jgi:ATP-dependent DNA helicase RecG
LPAEPLEIAARIFRAEAQDGYRDRVVIGGLAGYVQKLQELVRSPDVARAASVLHEYGSLEPSEREARLNEAQHLLGVRGSVSGSVPRGQQDTRDTRPQGVPTGSVQRGVENTTTRSARTASASHAPRPIAAEAETPGSASAQSTATKAQTPGDASARSIAAEAETPGSADQLLHRTVVAADVVVADGGTATDTGLNGQSVRRTGAVAEAAVPGRSARASVGAMAGQSAPRAAAPPAGVTLSTPIQALKGIGPVRARLYTRLNIHTVRDLLFHFPVRHQAFPPAAPIADLFFRAEGSVLGTLERLEVENLPRGLKRLKATVKDPTSTIYAVWLRHGFARLGVQIGDPIALSGKLIQQGRQLTLDSPEYERGDGPPLHTRGLVPVHALTAGLTDRELRTRIHWAVTHFAGSVADPLPEIVRTRHALLPIGQALRQMHFPRSPQEHADARRRFAFEELLTIQLLVLQRRLAWRLDPAAALPRQAGALDALAAGLPFKLTNAQQRVTDEILADIALERPMTRLLQGEVGSGKTAVAALVLVDTLANGYQGALMAPTAILAEQHYATLSRLFEAAGPRLEASLGRRPTLSFLTGSVTGKDRTRAYADAANGVSDILVGTQALIQDKLEFARLGLVIVDEQHRFGVRQRVTLRHRATEDSLVPHLLVMTATPIPRTLALSLYGDLDLSAIDEMPPGRKSPKTVLLGSDERHLAYRRVQQAVAEGEQAFIICPLVEESEVLEARSAIEEYERLRTGELASVRLGLLHGRMRPAEKDAVMRAFRDREFDVLVSTAVVEVGVDVPNATVMLIEGAERFGMAQLHQFRGRIGRGGQASVCILLTDLPDPQSNERLRIVARTTNGLTLAEHDLRLRGPGDYFGVRQSGLPELKVARLDDAPLVEAARSAAAAVLDADPELSQPAHVGLRTHLAEFMAVSGDPS